MSVWTHRLKSVICSVVGSGVFANVSLAQDSSRVTLIDLGPGASGRIVQEALAKPHHLVEPDTSWYIVPRGTQENTTLIVLSRTAAISGRVAGDVVVIGGDLFVRPGAHIEGRAVAIGGGVYPSALGVIDNGFESFRDNTFAITRAGDGYELRYLSLRENASAPLLFPGVYGLRIPTYDRVNGASIPFGPSLTFAGGRGEVNGLAIYRSDLGKVDPVIDGTFQLTRRSRAEARIGRETLSNDSWIWSNLVNSLSVLVFGTDTRNYYRADHADLTVHRLWEWTSTQMEPFVGGRAERAWSAGPGFGATSAPWSFWGRTDSLGMRRPNPGIMDGNITSALAGTTFEWQGQGVTLDALSGAEIALAAPADRKFVQVTTDVGVKFLTFGEQEYALDVHWVTTPSDAPPNQRFVYLGGAGTLPFEDLLDQGGDELLLIDQRYSYPLLNVRIGLFGTPTLLLRHRLGSAGLAKLPSFQQVLGAGVMLTLVRAEVQMDPATGKARFSMGLSFSR